MLTITKDQPNPADYCLLPTILMESTWINENLQ